MPLTGDEFEQRSADEILAFLQAELRAEFGEDIDLTESSAFRTLAEAISTVDAEEIEPALESVHDAAFLDSASGENLEKVVAILGVTRRSAVHATGTIRFDHESTVGQDYSIENGAIVQTDSDDPIQFETTEAAELSWFDDFESSGLRTAYNGQTGTFSRVDGSASGDPTPTEGSGELKADPTSGDKVFIGASGDTSVGSTMDFRVYLQDTDSTQNAASGNLFGVIDGSNFYRTRLDSSGEHAIEVSTSGGGVQTLASNSFNVPENEWLRNEIEWVPRNGGTIVSRIYDSNGNEVDSVSVSNEGTIAEGGFGFQQLGGTENVYWDHSGERAVMADARCRTGGTVGNIGANSLTVMPTVPNGVNTVTNPHPMGDDSNYLTTLLPFDTGVPRETDQELRERASVSEGAVGKATVPALIAEASALPEAESISVYVNRENTTDASGLPGKSYELVYYGNDAPADIAQMLHDTSAFTARPYGGAHGTQQSETVTASNGQTFEYFWSEPTEVSVDMTLDIVVNDEFVGEAALRDRIVEYIGGTLSDGTNTLGTGTGEDVYVDQVEDVVTGPEDTGVIGIGSYSFTPSTTTDSNGLEVISIGANEVASTNAQDGSIALNITRV